MVQRYLYTLLIAAGCLIGATGCFSPTSLADNTPTDDAGSDSGKCLTAEDAVRLADRVLELVNLERAGEGLAPVLENPTLTKLAEDYACRMIDEGFFDHYDPLTGAGPAERALQQDYVFLAIGENLAAGQQTPAEVMEVWMQSPSHRAIILDPKWEEVGVAVRSGGSYAIYWVQEFGVPHEE